MKVISLTLSIVVLVGCDKNGPLVIGKPSKRAVPIINHKKLVPGANIPLDCRWRNYKGGSCVYASGETVLSACGKDSAAKWMRENYSGGSSCSTLERVWQRKGFKTKATYDCDMKFLQWCVNRRLPAAIEYYWGHCVTFVYMNNTHVGLLDNNGPRDKIDWIPKAEFQKRWRGYGGNACTIISKPTVPNPYVPRKYVTPVSL